MDETTVPVDQATRPQESVETHSNPVVCKQCTLWVHDEAYSKDDILLNISAFPAGSIPEDALLKVVPLDRNIAVKDFEDFSESSKKDNNEEATIPQKANVKAHHRNNSKRDTTDGDGYNCFVFIAHDIEEDQKAKYPNLQLSISNSIANLFGLKSRSTVSLVLADHPTHSVSHIEIAFRDAYLTRADMWRMARAELSGRALYQGQKLLFMGTIRALVQKIYLRGKRAKSGLFTNQTKPIFRSESARFVLYIQMSKEMWDFDTEVSGEIMFNKVVNEFLPELFNKWHRLNVKHLVTIVLFTRMEYEDQIVDQPNSSGLASISDGSTLRSSKNDFYRVVVSEMPSSESSKILRQLQAEFKTFLMDVCVHPLNSVAQTSLEASSTTSEDSSRSKAVTGRPSIAMKGNLLEAINLASLRFAKDFVDRDLVRTGTSIVVISAGNAFFEVDESTLRLTTENALNNGIAIDLVCLSPMPLHSVPLFKYESDVTPNGDVSTPRNHSPSTTPGRQSLTADGSTITSKPLSVISSLKIDQNEDVFNARQPSEDWKFAIPHWIDVSFWMSRPEIESEPISNNRTYPNLTKPNDPFIRRCRMYELQMMGLMENEMSEISIPFLHEDKSHSTTKKNRDHYSKGSTDSAVIPASSHDGNSKGKLQDKTEATTNREHKHQMQEEHRWMNEYDVKLFEFTKQSSQLSEETSTSKSNGKASHHHKKHKDVHKHKQRLNGIADSLSSSPKQAFEDYNLSDEGARSVQRGKKSAAVTHSLSPKVSSPRVLSSSARTSTLRLLGGRGKDSSKALASTDSTFDHAKSSNLTQKADDFKQNGNNQPYAVSRQVRASLSRHVTTVSDRSPEPTQPIAIQKSPNLPISGKEDLSINDGQSLNGAMSERNVFGSSFGTAGASPRDHLTRKRGDTIRRSPTKSTHNDHLSPWLTLLNPCNPRKNSMNVANQFRRWQHVFPRPPRASDVKWKSLCSPAALPLTTEDCPTINQLENDFEESTYKIALGDEEELPNVCGFRTKLARELVGFRLARGFQLVLRRYSAGLQYRGSLDIFAHNFLSEEGASVYLSKGNTVHLISVTGSEVQVTRYQRKIKLPDPRSQKVLAPTYKPLMRREFEDAYTEQALSLSILNVEHNWNYIDNYIAGYQESFSDSLRFWCARFVLIPNEPPISSKRPLPAMPDDTDDEVYIEGLQKLTQLWEKGKITTDDRNVHAVVSERIDPNPLALEFQTRDASAVISAGLENSRLVENDASDPSTNPFGNSNTYRATNIDLQKLGQDIQGEKGIKIRDRRWHFRIHQYCFIGFDLTTWLLHNFSDVESREEAVSLGNVLMEKGLVQHVVKKHNFRDGNYFYTIAPEYRISRPESQGWFTRRVEGKTSIPPTPSPDISKETANRSRPRSSTEASNQEKSTNLSVPQSKKPKVKLSSVMSYDVDPRKRSYRPEIIKLHYDRLYNPDSCYHLRIEWMNTTAKLVEDAIGSWISTAERFGLRLVEVPIAEASSIQERHPFRSPYVVELALSPPISSPPSYFDQSHPDLIPFSNDNFFYYKAILRKFNFVLDLEAASNFPDSFDISYSWGKPDYKYSQYIHKSGVLLIQITDTGKFILLPNRLCNNRAAAAKETTRQEYRPSDLAFRPSTAKHQPRKSAANYSPFASPVVRAAATPDLGPQSPLTFVKAEEKAIPTPEQLKDQIEAFCGDVDALAAFYREFDMPPTPSHARTPRARHSTIPDSSIPTLTIPPSIAPAGGNGGSDPRSPG